MDGAVHNEDVLKKLLALELHGRSGLPEVNVLIVKFWRDSRPKGLGDLDAIAAGELVEKRTTVPACKSDLAATVFGLFFFPAVNFLAAEKEVGLGKLKDVLVGPPSNMSERVHARDEMVQKLETLLTACLLDKHKKIMQETGWKWDLLKQHGWSEPADIAAHRIAISGLLTNLEPVVDEFLELFEVF